MAPTKLYDKALSQFREGALQKWADPEIQILLEEFVIARSNPHEAQDAARKLQNDTNRKYGVDHGVIPSTWVRNIIGSIGQVIDFGNYALGSSAGPEGLAWTAVKIILGAVQSNYNLYALFGTGLTDVCDVMLLVTHYDRLNDKGSHPGWKPTEMVLNLLDTVVNTYVAVFEFSFSIKRHLNGGLTARLRHAVKDCFGIERDKFQAQLGAIGALKTKILQTSEAAFQDTTLREFQDIHGDLDATVKHIRGFQTQLDDIAKRQKDQTEALLGGLKELKSMTTERSPWGKALATFEKYTNDLKPLKQTASLLLTALEKKHEGTCEWVFTDPVYNEWERSTDNRMLCLSGQEGSGKSVILAAATDRLALNAKSDTVVIYVSCETIAFDLFDKAQFDSSNNTTFNLSDKMRFDLSDKKQKGSRIVTNTILHQLYSLAVDESKNTELLEACNQIFENRKKDNKQGGASVGMIKSLPDFYDAFPELSKKLKKHAIIAVDAVNLLQDLDQEVLFENLHTIVNNKSQWQCRVIVGCRSSARFFREIEDTGTRCAYLDISGDKSRADKELVLSSALRFIPGLTKIEHEQAKTDIMAKAGRRFNYITDIAIPFMQEPFQRPLSNRLAHLPRGMADTYSEALYKMSPNYVSLLRKALLWTLLCRVPPTIEEIMDDYRGTYDQTSAEGDSDDVDSQRSFNFPKASRLEKEQFRIASGPFLQLDKSGYVKLQDPDPIREFCLNSKESGDQNSDQARVCPHCSSRVKMTPTEHLLSITEKEGHLEMALTFLRHLNNPLFQRRFCFTDDRDMEADEKVPGHDQAEPKQEIETAAETDAQTTKPVETIEAEESGSKNQHETPGGDDGGPKDDAYDSEHSEDDS
ncbi:hypothetical protein F4803DRAFT_553809 [Xylaria telfairii]|nr:hypothetical protein F4803DRAFT_553809 [Xylaria telfairii]